MRTLLGAMTGALLIFAATHAQAQLAEAVRASETIQRQQQLQTNDQIRQGLERRGPTTRIDTPLPAKPEVVDGNCRDIQKIVLVDAAHLTDDEEAALAKPYLKQCLGVSHIQRLLSEITGAYMTKGYATARAYIPEQDLESGILRILIVEGQVSEVKLKDGGKGSLNIAGAFPLFTGDPLNLRRVEQGLDQVNRLASNHATMDVVPGKKAGDSILVINNEPTKRWHLDATVDNYGTRGTGRTQGGLTGSYDNLFGLNEFYSVGVRESLPLNDRGEQSDSENYLFSIPYGRSLFTAGYSESKYQSTLDTGLITLDLSGNSKTYFTNYDYAAYRNQTTRVNLTSALSVKDYDNFAAGQKLTVSSRRLSVIDVGVNVNHNIGQATVGGNLGVSQGISAFAPRKDPSNLPSDAPRAQYTKINYGASYYRPFEVDEHTATFSSSINGQYALDPLFGTEQISIGGIYSVRGFYDALLANDHGTFVRNDLALVEPLGSVYGQQITVRPYVGLDAGYVNGYSDSTPSGTLVGGAIGTSLYAGPASFDIYVGHPLMSPSSMDADGTTTFARFALAL